MKLDIATWNDNQELIQFYKEFPLKGLIDLKIDRNQDYFAHYNLHSNLFRTYLLRDFENKIQATASFVFRDTFFEGQAKRVAYATDLRVSSNRKAILEWAHHFLPVMQDVMKEFDVSSIFSAINLKDPTALNTFVRPRNMKRSMPRYYLYRKFNIVTLHGQFPWAKPALDSIKIRQGSQATLDALMNYVIRRSQYRPFASVWDPDSFMKKIERLPGLQLSDFLIAFDAQDKVRGCLAPWSSAGIMDYVPLSYSLQGHNFRQFLKFLWLFRLTRRLSKPVASTGFESRLQFRHLTHVFADNEDVFESLLMNAWENTPSNEFLLYAHTEHDYRLRSPRSWIAAHLPQALYSVVPPLEDTPAFLHPSISMNPEIESCYLI